MKYIFNEDLDSSLTERILALNNVKKESLDVSNFEIDYSLPILNSFKEKLLSCKDKRFFIVGDYDCDGICATAIIKKLFDDIGINSNYYIPSRSKDGYGINETIVNNAKNNNFDCIICLDNGIAAKDVLEYAKSLGLQVFIIDHHEYQNEPECISYLHPNLFPKEYAQMCAGGLCALLSNSFRSDDLTSALGGLATLADMVNIFDYNRYIVKQMLEIVKQGSIVPINLLLGRSDITYKNISFQVIPKINAVSRLDDLMNVNYVVRFLLSNESEAISYFDKIENINAARKEYSKQMYNLALRLVDEKQNIIVISHESFKEGLCGLVANRLLEHFRKPVIVFSNSNGILKGSGRSVPGFNMYEYLKNTDFLFETYGGHELAIGCSINEENYNKLLDYINNSKVEYNEQFINVMLLDESKIDFNTLDELQNLEPFGSGFVEPLLGFRNPNYISRYIVGGRFPKFDINDNLSAISFNSDFMNTEFDYMVGHLSKDNFNKDKLSFLIEDLV